MYNTAVCLFMVDAANENQGPSMNNTFNNYIITTS